MAKILTQTIVDPGKSNFFKNQFIFIWVGLLLVQARLGLTGSIVNSTAGQGILHDLRNQVFSYIQKLPLSYQSTTKRGDTISLLTNNAGAVSQFISNTVVSALPQIMVSIGAIALLTYTHLPFGLSTIFAAIGFVYAWLVYSI